MTLKWTDEEDNRLTKIVRRLGTQWALVQNKFGEERSRDSIIKRWHGKLKFLRTKKRQTQRRTTRKSNKDKNVNENKLKTKTIEKSNRKELIDNKNKGMIQNYEEQSSEQENESDENQQISNSESIDSKEKADQENTPFEFKKNWKPSDDRKLENLIVREGVLKWDKLANFMETDVIEVRHRWQKVLYQNIIMKVKIGNALKYSEEEDNILQIGIIRHGMTWEQLTVFLPARTEESLEARWRRKKRPQMEISNNNKHLIKRLFLKKIVLKRQSIKEPLIQDQHSIRDDQESRQ